MDVREIERFVGILIGLEWQRAGKGTALRTVITKSEHETNVERERERQEYGKKGQGGGRRRETGKLTILEIPAPRTGESVTGPSNPLCFRARRSTGKTERAFEFLDCNDERNKDRTEHIRIRLTSHPQTKNYRTKNQDPLTQTDSLGS